MRTFQSVYSNNVFFGLLERWFAPRGHAIETGGVRVTYALLLKNFIASLVPFILVAGNARAGVVVRGHPSNSRRPWRRFLA